MAKAKLEHVCSDCGTPHPKWAGQCSRCGGWNTLVEAIIEPPDGGAGGPPLPEPLSAPRPIGDVDPGVSRPRSTGVEELDRVLGGGIVPGSVTLLAGEPGVGKSTLLLQLLASWAGVALYVSAEESAHQVRLRAERLGAIRPDLWLLAETALPHLIAALDNVRPSLVVVDSIQTVGDPALGATPGSVGQVRACAHRLVLEAKRRDLAVVLVGHVTKDGAIAGPRVLEHTVDTVLSFDGERHHALRLLRAVKHRYGPTDQLGLFEMVGHGLVGVPDASRLFLADRRVGLPGSALVATLDGQRPLVVEVQALTAPAPPGVPARRAAQGIDGGRLALLLAVLQRHGRLPVPQHDVYASAVGGVRLTEPGLDLGLCLAVASALLGVPLPADLVAFGEVGLGGEVRQVGQATRRYAEAERLGFARVLAPANAPEPDGDIRIVRARTLPEAVAAAGLNTAQPTGLRAI